MNQLTSSFEEIGVNEALTLLQGNKNNRPVNKENLSAIESEINRGSFVTTGESIKISKTGVLLDGQHRLLAIVNAKPKKKLSMLIVRGLDDESFKFIDTGRKRTASDVLAVQGIKNSTAIAAMAKFIINFNRGLYASAVDNQNKRKARNTNNDISVFVNDNMDSLVDSYGHGFCKENKLVNKGVLASFHFITSKIEKKDADTFCDTLADGQGLTSDCPIYLLRQRLLSDIRSNHKISPIERIALICKAWNMWRKQVKASSLKWNSISEPFPKLV